LIVNASGSTRARAVWMLGGESMRPEFRGVRRCKQALIPRGGSGAGDAPLH